MIINRHNPSSYFVFTSICVLAFACFANGFSNDFVWDDEFYIQKNTYLKSFEHIPDIFSHSATGGAGNVDRFYRPLQFFLYLIVYQIAGESTYAFHALNLLIHILCALVFYLLIVKIWKNRWLALVSTLIWLCHPIHVETITYVSATADSLSALFMLLSVWLFWRGGAPNYSLSLICYGLALFSKESSAVIAAAMVAISYYRDHNLKRAMLLSLPYWGVLIGFFLFRIYVLKISGTFNFYDNPNIYTENINYRIYTFLAAVFEYFYILVYPVGLHMERGFPVFVDFFNYRTVVSSLFIFISLIYFWFHRKDSSNKYVFAFFWFFIFFIPMSGILVPVNSMLLEHWLYLTSMGWFVLLGASLVKLYSVWPRLSIVLTVIIIATLSSLTIRQNTVWATPIRLYTDILRHNEGSARVHNNLAMAYADKGMVSKAEKHYLTAIARADTYAETHYNLARLYIFQSKLNLAKKHLLRSLEINPNFSYAQKLLSELNTFLKKQGQ